MGIIDSLPPTHNKQRDEIILKAVQDGNIEFNISPIELTYKHEDKIHHGTFYVFNDALKIEGIRINVSAELQQKIADHMACMLMTAKIADMRFMQANTVVRPSPMPITSSTEGMIRHSKSVDLQLDGVKNPGIVATVGKHWIIDNKLLHPKIPNMALNYGWHFRGNDFQGIRGGLPTCYKDMPGVRMIQTIGTHHNSRHQDYSQICVLVDRNCVVNNEPRDLIEILKDPILSNLVSHNGPTDVWRQPDIPEPTYTFIPTLPINA